MRMVLSNKGLLLLTLVFVAFGLIGSSNAAINFDSATAIWLFDEGNGDEIKDFTGKGNDGELNDGVEWVDGKFGTALMFDGQTGTVEINTPVNLVDPDFTIMLWVNPGDTQARDHCDILSNHGEPPGAGYCIEQNGSDTNKFYFDFNAEGTWQSGWNIPGAPLTQMEADTWQHFAVVRKANVLTHYLNGEETESKDDISEAAVTESPKNLLLSNFGWGTIERQFNGIMDDLAIFNEALTVNDIKSVMNSGLVGAMAVSPSQKSTTCWSVIKTQHWVQHER